MTRKRLVRILLVVLMVLLFAGYFAFSTFLFSPTESDYEADLATLAPESVDFFVAKGDLAGEFDEFPELRSAQALQGTRAWGEFERSGQWAARKKELGLDRLLERVEEIKAQTWGTNLIDVFGGSDLALAGNFGASGGTSDATWAVYGRANWKGKLALAVCQYPGLIGLSEQGIEAKLDGEFLEFSGTGIPEPVHVTRIHDVIVASNSADFVKKARELDGNGGQGSFGQGAQYFDYIQHAPRNARQDEIELAFDWRELSKALAVPERWPDAQSEDLWTALAGRVFQLGSMNRIAGVVGFDGGLQANLHADLSSELMTTMQQKLYRKRGADNSVFARDVARMVRADTALFVVVEVPLGDLLRELLASSEEALRANLEDLLRELGQFKPTGELQTHTDALIAELDALFRDRFALLLRANDYPLNANDAPHDDTPAPAWTIALWTDGSEKARLRIKELSEMVSFHYRSFGISGREAGERGVFTNNCQPGNYEIWEFWSRFVPGTGHIATAVNGDVFLVSNHYRMVCEALNTRDNGRNDPMFPRLVDRPDFMRLATDSLPQANVMAWVEPKALGAIASRFTQRAVKAEISARIDWKRERARIENEVMKDAFPGRMRSTLEGDDKARFDELVEARLAELENKLLTEQAPGLEKQYERTWTYFGTFSALVAMLALDPKKMDLSLRGYVPLGD
ncbi:MAG: hypothetical protein HZA52_17970 [Planctomycetes bacterium]|nr:hypothetical protein [Planctomycetota bacterium]